MTTQLAPSTFYRDFDNQGNPLAFGSVYTYIAGTSTLTATYVDSTQTTPNTNPIILNARGEAQIWLVPGNTYKFAVFDQYGNQIRIVDQIYSLQGLNALTQSTIGALLYPSVNGSVTTYDTTQTQALIGNAGLYATNLWSSAGTAGSRLQEFANAFEYIASGGGAFNNDADFGVALYAAAKITGGSRAIFAFNAVTEVDVSTRQAGAFAIEGDVNNNSSGDVGLTTNAYDQIISFRAASGGNFKPQVGFQSWAGTAVSRFRIGGALANWSDYGLVIVQDPGTVTTDASGTNTGTSGSATTGPCILLQPSTDGSNPIFRLRNAANTADSFMILQNGSTQLNNNQTLGWIGSDAVVRTAVVVSATDNAYFLAAKTNGVLVNQALQSCVTWSSVASNAALGFFSQTPSNLITGYGTPTGGSHQSSFAAGSITLANLAAAVAQLIVDLKTYGLIGA